MVFPFVAVTRISPTQRGGILADDRNREIGGLLTHGQLEVQLNLVPGGSDYVGVIEGFWIIVLVVTVNVFARRIGGKSPEYHVLIMVSRVVIHRNQQIVDAVVVERDGELYRGPHVVFECDFPAENEI